MYEFPKAKMTFTIKLLGTIIYLTMPIWIWFYLPIIILFVLYIEWLPPKNWKAGINDICLSIIVFLYKMKGKKHD